MLLHAANSYDERKVPHLGWLYAALLFAPEITAPYANLLLHLADELTYRQLATLAFLASESAPAALTEVDACRAAGGRSTDAIIVGLAALGGRELTGLLQDDGTTANPFAVYGGHDLRRSKLVKLRPTLAGLDLCRLMKLDRIPSEELHQVFVELRGKPDDLGADC